MSNCSLRCTTEHPRQFLRLQQLDLRRSVEQRASCSSLVLRSHGQRRHTAVFEACRAFLVFGVIPELSYHKLIHFSIPTLHAVSSDSLCVLLYFHPLHLLQPAIIRTKPNSSIRGLLRMCFFLQHPHSSLVVLAPAMCG